MRVHPPGTKNIDRKCTKDPGDRLGDIIAAEGVNLSHLHRTLICE